MKCRAPIRVALALVAALALVNGHPARAQPLGEAAPRVSAVAPRSHAERRAVRLRAASEESLAGPRGVVEDAAAGPSSDTARMTATTTPASFDPPDTDDDDIPIGDTQRRTPDDPPNKERRRPWKSTDEQTPLPTRTKAAPPISTPLIVQQDDAATLSRVARETGVVDAPSEPTDPEIHGARRGSLRTLPRLLPALLRQRRRRQTPQFHQASANHRIRVAVTVPELGTRGLGAVVPVGWTGSGHVHVLRAVLAHQAVGILLRPNGRSVDALAAAWRHAR